MALTERTRPYETLIRHNVDGTTSAHHRFITEILRDGTVVSATVEHPQTLTAAEGDALNFDKVIGTVSSEVMRENEKLKADLAEALAQNSALTQQLAEANKRAEQVPAEAA